MKDKLFVGIGIIVFLVGCGIGIYHMENYDEIYYTQIDNTKVEKLSTSDDMKYEYTLECYIENGNKKELKFKTSRELREDAYLQLEVKTFGVHKWQEIQYDELPLKVQEVLNDKE